MIKIIVNGKEYQFEKELTVFTLLQYFNLNPYRIVVQINESEVVPKESFQKYKVKNGDRVEFVKFMAGG